ncbi:phosphomannomutase/phosphoglucomutase [Candidatus Pandoraea novymonadis]|uniref:Phosphomannomutase/phosphoglucomutase n=1 Tax=Candidatus Pandoraea novymonadis TaxID=1808959 RepID=A0ABX5FF71_9BURK|nr:phosphomannomutase/phosphoglucomutase [Candidatus Pandoraea novymonadis]PSB92344.1 Phosphomannomutase/phosphoglucomutase [Candidatus Pandoraea novymonadis]
MSQNTLPSHLIFKVYDIRGVVGDSLNANVAYQIGLAFGTHVRREGGHAVIMGRDGRISGSELSCALSEGLCATGVDIVDIGMVTTPLMYFATNVLINGCKVDSGIMVTGSHNPSNYNGFKMVLRGDAIYGDAIQALYRTIEKQDYETGKGIYSVRNVTDAYQTRVVSDIVLKRPMKIAIDCGNGVAGAFAPQLFRAIGCDVAELFCDVDGTFPNHHPDPAHPENLRDLIECIRETNSELGLAFDGDGDRLGVVTKDGEIIYPDRQLMLFAAEVLRRFPGETIIYDVKCTRNLAAWVTKHGGYPKMWKTGHSLMKAKLKEMGAPLAGEMSGHIFFKDRWYGFDDGLYTGARLLEILSESAHPSEVLNALPSSLSTPELHIKCTEGENFLLIDKLRETANFANAEQVVKIDGLRVEYADGFGLVRASNTTPAIVLRFEADNEVAIRRIQKSFREAILKLKLDAILPF